MVINKDGVDVIELRKNNLGVYDLIESMRTAGYFTFDDLSYAIYEANGSLSAFPNRDKTDESNSIPLLIVAEGKIVKENLDFIKSTKENIINFIKKQKTTLKNTEVLTIDGFGRVYFKQKHKKYIITKYNLKEGISW